MGKSITLVTSNEETINLVDSSIVSAIDVGEIPYLLSFPFSDSFVNNINGWGPASVGISSGNLTLATNPPNYAYLRSLFLPSTLAGTYRATFSIDAFVGTPRLYAYIVDDAEGAANIIYAPVGQPYVEIVATGDVSFDFIVSDPQNDLDTLSDFYFYRDMGTSITISDLLIEKIS